jgi:hypothetical protein
MNQDKQDRLEVAGWKVGDAAAQHLPPMLRSPLTRPGVTHA